MTSLVFLSTSCDANASDGILESVNAEMDRKIIVDRKKYEIIFLPIPLPKNLLLTL